MSTTPLANFPAMACDSHVHTFDPAQFPYAPARRFTPPPASVAALQQFRREQGVARTVLVQPSVYGHDHRCLLHSLQVLGEGARGVAVLGPQTSASEVDALAGQGVCGHRVNLAVDGVGDAESAARRVQQSLAHAPGDWHLQLHAGLGLLAELRPWLQSLPQVLVIDHFGLPQAAQVAHAPRHAGWRALLDLVAGGRVYVKLSAPYLCSRQGPLYDDLQPLVASLAEVAPGRLLWGSNWPHTQGTTRSAQAAATEVEPFRHEDDRALLAQLQRWLGPALSQQVLVDNPAALYRF